MKSEDWDYLQNHLISAYRRNASLISFFVEVLILRQNESSDVDKERVRNFLERWLPKLAQENRTGEIIWLLFLAIRLKLELCARKLSSLFRIENSMIALLMTYACHNNLLHGNADHSKWQSHLTKDGLKSKMWLYSYESMRNKTNGSNNIRFIEDDSFFSILLRKNIGFFDPGQRFKSIDSEIRLLKSENIKAKRLRDEYSNNFEIDLGEFDDDDDIDRYDIRFRDDY